MIRKIGPDKSGPDADLTFLKEKGRSKQWDRGAQDCSVESAKYWLTEKGNLG